MYFFHFEGEGYAIYIFLGKEDLYLLKNFWCFRCFLHTNVSCTVIHLWTYIVLHQKCCTQNREQNSKQRTVAACVFPTTAPLRFNNYNKLFCSHRATQCYMHICRVNKGHVNKMAKIQWKGRLLLQKTKNYIEEGGTFLMHNIVANKQPVSNLSNILIERWFQGDCYVTFIVYPRWLFVKYANVWLLSVNFASETNLLKITFRSLTYNHFTSWGTCTDTALEPLFWFVDHFVKYLGPVSTLI